jgi:hypothetical protein
MKNVIELIDLYADVNQQVIREANSKKPQLFIKITEKITQIREGLKQLPVDSFQVSRTTLK